jgi:hypothetical protein
MWRLDTGWQSNLNLQGSQDMARMSAFLRSFGWQTLAPSGLDGRKTIVTANGSSPSNQDYVACAVDTGTVCVCYVPPAWTLGTFTIDSTVMSSPYRARWFNPATAGYTAIGTGIANTGSKTFTPPGDNGSGFTDWVLVLDVP